MGQIKGDVRQVQKGEQRLESETSNEEVGIVFLRREEVSKKEKRCFISLLQGGHMRGSWAKRS